ncbi:separase isoform X2 [Nymphaea colorata]|uniref:separase isoform X2 n=1 Tax=Nymphaea colorata TaxID=210225 RepID=UPI00214E951C|nr:separase isoform X2 [Nymphaea colorata]
MDADGLIARLEKLETDGLRHDFSAFFQPLLQYQAGKKKKRKATAKNNGLAAEDSQIRALAKQFLPILSRLLKLCPNLLSSPSTDADARSRALVLFQIFEMTLDCFDCVSPCLDGKPFQVDLQRYRLVLRLEGWKFHDNARKQCYLILGRLRSHVFSSEIEPMGSEEDSPSLFPDKAATCDPELALLVVEIVASIVRCTFKSKCKEMKEYDKILILIEQVCPWLSIIDQKTFQKFHGILLEAVYNCTKFVVGESLFFQGDVVSRLCIHTISMCLRSHSKDMFTTIVCGLSSSLGAHCGNLMPSVILDIIKYVLEAIVCKCKHGMILFSNQILEIVNFCMNSLRSATRAVKKDAALLLDNASRSSLKVVSPSLTAILNVYSAGLFILISDVLGNQEECISGSLLSASTYSEEFENCFHTLSMSINLIHSDIVGGVLGGTSKVNPRSNDFCTVIHGKLSLISYLNGLAFFCKPFADLAKTEWKYMSLKKEVLSSGSINHILDVLYLFCDAVVTGFSDMSIKEREKMCGRILLVVKAALKISFVADGNSEKILSIIKCIISREWIQPQDLKFLTSTLYNAGLLNYKENQLDKASVALEACYHASWALVSLGYGRSARSLGESSDDGLSVQAEDADSIADACSKTAFFLEVLNLCGSPSRKNMVVESLLRWSDACVKLGGMSRPKALVKHWAKMICEEFKDNSLFEDAPTLYSVLRYSNTNLSDQKLGIILEEEILAYAELGPSYPSFCSAMQERITNVLLSDVYVTPDSYFQKAKAFIIKSQIASMHGVEGLKCSIDSLHEAISVLNYNLDEARASGNASVLHLLALTHCLRALCSSEADKNIEAVLQDIYSALELWSSMKALDMSFSNIQLGLVIGNELPLLYHTADLLAVKGLWHLRYEILVLIVMLSKLKEIPEEEILAMLCRYRRLHHTFCLLPVDKELLLKLQQQFDVSYCSVAFWMSCVKVDALSLHGFQQEFIPSHFVFQQGSCGIWKGSAPVSFKNTEELKASVSALSSNECRDSHSTFMVAYLYYDLCDQLSSRGQLNEALLYSRKALQLRRKLLQRSFPFSVEKKTINGGSDEAIVENKSYHVHVEAPGAAMKSVWADMAKSGNPRSSFFNSWSLLKCFLESSLQVGIIHDLIGNGDDAEDFFLIGKKISYLQGLSFFEALFSSWLGHIYRRKQLWDLSEKEIFYGKTVLKECTGTGFCNLCKLTLESTLEMRLADLMRSRFEWSREGTLAPALEHYKLAKGHLDTFGSEIISYREPNSRSCCKGNCVAYDGNWSKTDTCICSTDSMQGLCGICATWNNHYACLGSGSNQSKIESLGDVMEGERIHPNNGSKKSRSRKTRSSKNLVSDSESLLLDTAKQKLPKGKRVGTARGCRRYLSSTPINHQVEKEDTSQLHSSEKQILSRPSMPKRMSSCQEVNADFSLKFGGDGLRLQSCSDCWRCFNVEVTQTGCIVDLILLKLENHWRNLFLKLLIQMGKCRRLMKIEEAHAIFCQSIVLLFYRNASFVVHSGVLHHLIDYIREGNKDDLLSVDHALLLYQISWFCLDHRLSDQLKMCSCGLHNVPLETIVSLLLHAFIICREVPLVFQKVSRLLAVIHLISMPGGPFSLPVDTSSSLSLIHWAAYFHQASIGSYLHHQNFVALGKKQEQEPCLPDSDDLLVEACDSLRVAPNNIGELEGFVLGFFQHLPSTSILCISLIGGDCANFLSEMSLLPCAHVSAWIFLSRLAQNQQPVSFLLPVDVIFQEIGQVDADFMVPMASSSGNSNKRWVCPWGRSILDEVSPGFRQILEENYMSGSSLFLADTGHNRSVWWKWRTLLNKHLDDLLRNIEESWFGPWKCLLLGDLVCCSSLDKVLKKLMANLRSCNFEVNESLLRVVLSSASSVADPEACVSQLLSYGGWLGFGDCCSRTKGRVLFPSSGSDEEESLDASSQLILNALSELEEQPEAPREPFILVLDIDVQMLPWESLPVLHNQEVYRMPSVGSVLSTLNRWSSNEVWARRGIDDGGNFPCINLFDAFYLLNPGGDLSGTQAEFEDWFKSQNWEGRISIPSEEELAWALEKHDLFLYFGHGSGEQYLSRHKIEMLNHCAAALLMGCSSGCLSYQGCYLPKGIPLSYLIAGCPAVISNLWDVTDKDIDKLSKQLLKDWLEHHSTACTLEEKFQNLEVASSTKLRKKAPRGNKKATSAQQFNHKFRPSDGEGSLRVASSMGKARDACRLPFLIGASSVCYGVPTFLSKKGK